MPTSRLLFFFLLAFPFTLWAQSDKPVGGHFGLKLGASFTQIAITGTSVNISKRSLEPHLGVIYRYRYHKLVAQPEVLLSVKGGTFQQEQTGGTRSTSKIAYYYASVPLMFGFIPTEGLTVQAGPEFSYALNAGQAGGPGATNDLGIAAGIHYDFLDMLSKASLHIRYVYGLVNVSPEATAAYYNRNLQISLVYNFYQKKKKVVIP